MSDFSDEEKENFGKNIYVKINANIFELKKWNNLWHLKKPPHSRGFLFPPLSKGDRGGLNY